MALPLAKPRLLMCSAEFFGVAPPDPQHGFANTFEADAYSDYLKDPVKFRAEALEQSANLREVFAPHANVILLPPQEGLHDQVFTADPSFSLSHNGQTITVLSRFSNEKRGGEIQLQESILVGLNGNRILKESPYALEGTGDNLYDPARDIIWSGYVDNPGPHNAMHGRSDKRAHAFLSTATGVRVVSLRTQKPFYHIDTVMAPLAGGHILVHEAGLPKGSLQILKHEAFERFNLDPREYLISVSAEDAARFAVNLRCFGTNIVMPQCSQILEDSIRGRGYNVETVNLSRFFAAGGSGHCLSNAIDEPRVEGGILQQPEIG